MFAGRSALRMSREDVFMSRVEYAPSGCWLWAKSATQFGSGRIGRRLAHIISWGITHGPIPPGLQVLHRCDVPQCVNPDHLFLGTHKDNVQDMIRKGRKRVVRGENHPSAKLTDSEVSQIRSLRAEGKRLTQVAALYSISFQHVSAICRRTCREG